MEKIDQIQVATFYRFVKLADCETVRAGLLEFCERNGIRGTILLAEEGVNSTIAGSPEAITAFFQFLERDEHLAGMEYKSSYTLTMPFNHLKLKIKSEVIKMGLPNLDPTDRGDYADATMWQKLLADPEVVVVDTRNDYEVRIGTFKGALNPATADFQEFPQWVDGNLDPAKHKKVAMFCTGGIRCEKSTSYLRSKGFEEVWHLKGGILQYLEDTGNSDDLWQGECFVFDDRVALDASLQPTGATRCGACGSPVPQGGICAH